MSCYQCGSTEGSEFALCPACRVERASRKVSVRGTVNSSESGFKPYLRIVWQEWHLAVGGIVMVLITVKAVTWFLFHPGLTFDPTGVFGPDGESLYNSCVEQITASSLEGIDTAALVAAYRDQLSAGDGTAATPAADQGEAPEELIRRAVELRADEACSAVRIACESNPESPECQDATRTYVENK